MCSIGDNVAFTGAPGSESIVDRDITLPHGETQMQMKS